MAEEQAADKQYAISWTKAIVIAVVATAAVLAFGLAIEAFAQAVGYESR